jgi:hypothetical protein
MLLRVHEMMVWSALEYGSAVSGSAINAQLKRLEPVHNKELSAFWVCRTKNIMCESRFESLVERRKRKFINKATHVAEKSSHPVNRNYQAKIIKTILRKSPRGMLELGS